jgi:hypothetical protein
MRGAVNDDQPGSGIAISGKTGWCHPLKLTDGALVRLITAVQSIRGRQQAGARLTAFTQAIVPVLDELLPK